MSVMTISFIIGFLLPDIEGVILALTVGIFISLYSEDFLKGRL